MKLISGDMGVCGKIGYCPQQAWIRNCSVRDNIIFDQPFDEERYRMVIEQCALENDLPISLTEMKQNLEKRYQA